MLAVSLLSGAPATAVRSDERAVGDTNVFATVPYPGHPGGVAVDGDVVYVPTFNMVDRQTDDADSVFTYDRVNGALRTDRPNPIEVPRMMPGSSMGLIGGVLDAGGRLYLSDMNGRIVRIDPLTGSVEDYATFPTNSGYSFTNMPGFNVFDEDGYLYTGDASGAPIVWRIPPGGGIAEPWFVDPRLTAYWGDGLGGLTIDPSGEHLYLAVRNGPFPVVYRLPLDAPDASRLEVFHRYEASAPFSTAGIAFGESGKLYVSLSFLDQISILNADGTEDVRFPSAEDNAARDVPYEAPIALGFDGEGSLLVANTGNPFNSQDLWVLFDVWVNDTAAPAARPSIPD